MLQLLGIQLHLLTPKMQNASSGNMYPCAKTVYFSIKILIMMAHFISIFTPFFFNIYSGFKNFVC